MEMKDENPAYYSIKEFALKVRVHPNTIRNSIKNGRLNAFRIGIGRNANYRIPSSETQRLALFDLKGLIDKLIQENNGSSQK